MTKKQFRIIATTAFFLLVLAIPAIKGLSWNTGRAGREQWTIIFQWPGQDAVSIERDLGKELENQLERLYGLVDLNMLCEYGQLKVYLECRDNTQSDNLREIIDLVHSRLPKNVPRPQLLNYRDDEGPVWVVAVTGESEELHAGALALKNRLSTIEEAGECELLGLEEVEYVFNFEDTLIEHSGLSLQEIIGAIKLGISASRAGQTNKGRAHGLYIQPGLPLKDSTWGGRPYYLESGNGLRLNDYGYGQWEARNRGDRAFLNGQDLVLLTLRSGKAGNLPNLSEKINCLANEVLKDFPLLSLTVLKDSGGEIKKARYELIKASSFSVLLVFIACLFLCLWRMPSGKGLVLSLFTLFSLALTLFFSGIVLMLLGLSQTEAFLLALAISAGFLADSFLITLDTVLQGRELGLERGCKQKINRLLLPSIGTSLIALLPILSVEGTEIKIIAQVLLVSIFISFVCARYFYLPFILEDPSVSGHIMGKNRRVFNVRPVKRVVFIFSKYIMQQNKKFLAIIFIASLLSFVGMCSLSSPGKKPLANEFYAQISFEAGTKNSIVEEEVKELQGALVKKFRGIDVWSSISQQVAKLHVVFKDSKVSHLELSDYLKKISINYGFLHIPEDESGGAWWQIEMLGESYEQARRWAIELAQKYREQEEVQEVVLYFAPLKPSIYIVPDAMALISSGIYVQDLYLNLRRKTDGLVVGKYLKENIERDVRIGSAISAKDQAPSLQKLMSVPIALGKGKMLALKDLAHIEQIGQPTSILKSNRQASASFSFKTGHSNVQGAKRLYEKIKEASPLPLLYRSEFDKQALNIERESKHLKALVFLSLISCIIYLILLQESLKGPLVCLLVLLPSIGLVFPIMFIFRVELDREALCAFMVLCGFAINAAIVVFETIKTSSKKLLSPRAAGDKNKNIRRALYISLIECGPIVFANSATGFLACLPFIFVKNNHNILAQKLSIICATGSVLSAVFALLLLPVLYVYAGKYTLLDVPANNA